MKRKDQGIKDLLPAPGDLRLLQAFVNTRDSEAETDALASPRALADWLTRHGLLAPGTELDEADWKQTIGLREDWRSLIGGSLRQELTEALDRATESALLRARHDDDGTLRLEPAAGGLDGALGRLLAIVLRAQNDGTWPRLKVCASPSCRAVFYDLSDSRSRRWCRPPCGNRTSSRISKRRRRRAFRQSQEAKRRTAKMSLKPHEPNLAELEKHPELGDLARQVRELDEGQ